jgi:hypothetical protein
LDVCVGFVTVVAGVGYGIEILKCVSVLLSECDGAGRRRREAMSMCLIFYIVRQVGWWRKASTICLLKWY